MEITSTNPANAAGAATGVRSADKSKEDAKLKAACKDMESVFLNMLLTQMRRSVPKNGLLPRSSQQDIMQSMLDTELTKNMSQAGGTGLAEMLYRQLSVTVNNTTNKGQAPK